MAKERAGVYNRNIGSSAIFTLCKMAKRRRLINSSIRSVVQPLMPSQKELTYRNLFYIRAKIHKILPHYEKHPDYASFAETMDDGVFLDGIDNDFDLDDDHATQLATELWLEILGGNEDSSDTIINIQQYMELIASKAKGFVYAFALDSEGKANGLVWQTATMRRNFEIWGIFCTRYNEKIYQQMALAIYGGVDVQ
jgi:hypothetical protein